MELNTYGDLKRVIKFISTKQKGEKLGKVALETLVSFIPGVDAAKSTFDFVKAAFSKPDIKKTNTWLDKLDIDDKVSSIIDDTVENSFLQYMSKIIDSEPDDKPLEQDFNMNSKLIDFLKSQYAGRTITGVRENKLITKNHLKQIIKEEINKVLSEITPTQSSTEVIALKKYLQGSGKSALSQINTPLELKDILNIIWDGMNPSFRSNATSESLKNIIDSKLK
jgi:hypothetical protein